MKVYVGMCEWVNVGGFSPAFFWGGRIHVFGPGGSSHILWGKSFDAKQIGIKEDVGAGRKMAIYSSPVTGDPAGTEPVELEDWEIWKKMKKLTRYYKGKPAVELEISHLEREWGVSQRIKLWEIDL